MESVLDFSKRMRSKCAVVAVQGRLLLLLLLLVVVVVVVVVVGG